MTNGQMRTTVIDTITRTVDERDLTALAASVAPLRTSRIVEILGQVDSHRGAVLLRVLPMQQAEDVFEGLPRSLQDGLTEQLAGGEIRTLLSGLDPDDRARLPEALPRSVASRIMQVLSEQERGLLAVLGTSHGPVTKGERTPPRNRTPGMHRRGTGTETHPYLSAPVLSAVRSRVVWLLVLAIGATLTVQVLSTFEATLEQLTVLTLFVPLLIGTGGNTGNQAATTVTRALALGEVTPRDALRVVAHEVRIGASLGILLGAIAFAVTGLLFGPGVGLVIGLTLVAVCAVAASVGGVMPLAARALRVDPAVFSNPFISTFVDAAGLIIYLLIARAVLGL